MSEETGDAYAQILEQQNANLEQELRLARDSIAALQGLQGIGELADRVREYLPQMATANQHQATVAGQLMQITSALTNRPPAQMAVPQSVTNELVAQTKALGALVSQGEHAVAYSNETQIVCGCGSVFTSEAGQMAHDYAEHLKSERSRK